MDRGFNLALETNNYNFRTSAVESFKAENSNRVKNLAALMITKDTFDASFILNTLFPTVKADIFLSHSFQDSDKAIQLAMELKESCGLDVFIDSCVWGSVYALQKTIDNEYCLSENGKTYDYDERNRSTAHLHMILSTALQRMIDQTDTILFLNTDQSISLKHSVKDQTKTLSPWIHMELSFSSLVRRKLRKTNAKNESIVFDHAIGNESFNIIHEAPINHFTKLTTRDFERWMKYSKTNKGSKAIDFLYANFNR